MNMKFLKGFLLTGIIAITMFGVDTNLKAKPNADQNAEAESDNPGFNLRNFLKDFNKFIKKDKPKDGLIEKPREVPRDKSIETPRDSVIDKSRNGSIAKPKDTQKDQDETTLDVSPRVSEGAQQLPVEAAPEPAKLPEDLAPELADKAANGMVSFERGFADVIKKVGPAVVSIMSVQEIERKDLSSLFEDFFKDSPFGLFGDDFGPKKKKKQAMAAASGFCVKTIGDKLYIATNYHVVENSTKVVVFFQKIDAATGAKNISKQAVTAKVHGIDPKSDLAVLEVDLNDKNVNRKNIKTITWGNSDKMKPGYWVLAIGNPFGIGISASQGIISAEGRKLDSFGALALSKNSLTENYIQHTAAINSGNSGGILVNVYGEIIGVNSAIYSPNGGNVGIGFAIPASTANIIIDSLITHKKTFRGWLGVTIQQLTYKQAQSLNIIPPAFKKLTNEPELFGAYVTEVRPNGPAAKAGIIPEDIIIGFNDTIIDENHSLPELVNNHKAREKAKISLLRQDKATKAWEPKEIEVDIGDYAEFEKTKNTDDANDDNQYTKIDELGVIVGDEVDSKSTRVIVKKVIKEESTDIFADLFGGFSSVGALEVGHIIESISSETLNNSGPIQIENSKHLANVIHEISSKNPNAYVVIRAKGKGYNSIIISTTLKPAKKDDKKETERNEREED